MVTTTELGLPALRSRTAVPRDPARPADPRLVDRFGRVATDLRISLPADLAPLVVDKGSISVDGTSLTVSAVSAPADPSPWFEVSLIPETLAATTLGVRAVGDRVNLETDILARHVERLLAFRAAPEGGSR